MIIENTKRYVWNDTTRCLEGYRVNTVISSNKKDNYPLTFIKTQPQMHIGIASVVFVLPHKKQWSLIDISYILQHELQHVYDSFSSELSIEKMNRDVLVNNVVGRTIPERTINSFIDYNTTDAGRRQIITSNNNYTLIKDVVKAIGEYLNFSELHAYLFNFINDIKKAGYRQLKQFEYNQDLEQYLPTVSPVYAEYCGYSMALQALYDHMSVKAKRDYAQIILEYIYSGNVSPEPDCEYPYGRSFANPDGTFDESSTDEFLMFMIIRCGQFVADCKELYTNAHQLTERFIDRRIHRGIGSFPYSYPHRKNRLYESDILQDKKDEQFNSYFDNLLTL